MTENFQAYGIQRRKPLVVRCCLKFKYRRQIHMNETINALKQRRSIRGFTPEMPKKDDIDAIIDAGLYAANGRGKQAVITIAVTDKQTRDRLSDDNRKIGGWEKC